MTEAFELLERRYQLVARVCADEPKEILGQAFAFWEFLQSDPRLASACDSVLDECFAKIRDYRERDAELARQLQDIRLHLVRAHPQRDDSSRPPPGPNQHDASYARSLAMFDQVRESDPGLQLGIIDDDDPPLTSARLLRILRTKVDDEAEPDDVWSGPFDRLAPDIERLRREWILFTRTSISASVARLLLVHEFLHALTTDGAESPSDRFRASLGHLTHPLSNMRRALYGDPPRAFPLPTDEQMPQIVVKIVEHTYEAVRERLGTQNSHRRLVQRFCLRAQLYDAEELRKLARSKTRREDALTERLARFAFDQGMNPLTRPLVGGLEPDLLDPSSRWTFYVEAKQYENTRGRQTIISGMRQVWDTLARIRDYPHPVHEAFYVVFRLGGPRYVLPDELRSEGVTVYPVLVDIAPTKLSGSRQKQAPIRIETVDLMPRKP